MNILAFVLALAAIVAFLVAAWTPAFQKALGIGLAFLTTAWIVQLVWTTGSKISTH